MGLRRASQATPATGFFGQPAGARFNVIAADPAWPWSTWGEVDERGDRRAERHYDTMSIEEIMALPIGELADKRCALFLWITWPHLLQAGRVLDAWGFDYSGSGFIWVKTRRSHCRPFLNPEFDLHMGLGKTSRKNTEPCLLAFRGGPPERLDAGVMEPIFAPVREHSRKPDEAYDRMLRLYGGPAVELFAREPREDWACWSNEIGRFSEGIAHIGEPTWHHVFAGGRKANA
jgi:N6-adenosine-specific RNA methylase IME4